MKPFYWHNENFGDHINSWIWPKIIGDILGPDDGVRLIGIGSLIRSELNHVQGKKVIFGTGGGYGLFPDSRSMGDWFIYFVRGPLTAEYLGIDSNKSIIDGSWLISLVPEISSIPSKKGISFIPHWKSAQIGNWQKVCKNSGFNYIDPTDDLMTILKSIASSELVITESLHGAIIADYYRTPWIPVRMSPQFNNFKWLDWCKSVDLSFKVAIIPPSDIFDFIYNRRIPRSGFDSFEVVSNLKCEECGTSIVNKKPGFIYKSKANIKKMIQLGRKSTLNSFYGKRDNFLARNWNEKHRDCLREALLNLSKSESFLSKDSIRQEKIEQLKKVRNDLVADYHKGILF